MDVVILFRHINDPIKAFHPFCDAFDEVAVRLHQISRQLIIGLNRGRYSMRRIHAQ
jgi:hypothetical protein